jgi:broad specificity phosphatase PhoE
MRHGTTEMNVYLSTSPFGSPGFQDPLLYDTRLTPAGVRGAQQAAARAARLAPPPQLLVVSPLSRALHTAALAFGEDPGCPVVVEPLWRERLYLSSDCGRAPALLAADFPQ